MSSKDPTGLKSPVPTQRLAGPIDEYDEYDRLTGYTYFRCRHCGAEALKQIHLKECCELSGSGSMRVESA